METWGPCGTTSEAGETRTPPAASTLSEPHMGEESTWYRSGAPEAVDPEISRRRRLDGPCTSHSSRRRHAAAWRPHNAGTHCVTAQQVSSWRPGDYGSLPSMSSFSVQPWRSYLGAGQPPRPARTKATGYRTSDPRPKTQLQNPAPKPVAATVTPRFPDRNPQPESPTPYRQTWGMMVGG